MNLDPIRQFIKIHVLDDIDAVIDDDDDLLLTQTLDSLGAMRLAAHLEEIHAIRIPPGDVTLENFRTLRLIGDYLNRRTANQDVASAPAGANE